MAIPQPRTPGCHSVVHPSSFSLHLSSPGQCGYLLLEALVTMLVVTLGLMSLGQLIALGAVSAVENRYRQVGTRVAQQFMESAKGMNYQQLKGLIEAPPQPRCSTESAGRILCGHDVYVRVISSQIFIDEAPTGNAQYFPTAVTYAYTTPDQNQITVTADVGYSHRGITRHVTMTTSVLNGSG